MLNGQLICVKTEGILYLLDLDRYHSDKAEFLRYYVSNSIQTIRQGIALAALLYCAFAVLDTYCAPETYRQMWMIRFALVVPSLTFFYWLSYSQFFLRFSQPMMTLLFSITSAGIIIMIAVSHSNEIAYKNYYVGLILVTIGQHAIVRLKTELSTTLSFTVLAGYNVVVLVTHDLNIPGELTYLVSSNFFLFSAIVLGFFGSKTTEEMFRRDFFQKQRLSASHKELDELNGVKTKLLSIISHDLRGPLANTKAILDLLRKGCMNESEFRERADQLLGSVSSAGQMLDNLLAWSLFHVEKRNVVKQKVSLKELTDNVFALLKPHADQKLVRLVNSIEPDSTIYIQSTLVELVIRNLVANAIKYTEDGKVEVSATLENAHAVVSVEDTGRGMSAEIANNLFSWEKKTSSLGTKKERGTGIGLLICKEFLEKHQGSIQFKTEIGKGTTFTFKLGLN
ncbi:hypothetical protein WSM22_32040 [Cytophagales bacterium WSM2-2]|nr:hypothetical protein WSM22_32040 [Cytophagales bacterium WSM2-2]